MNQVAGLKEQLSICNQAYEDLLKKYNKLYQKYSYEETIDKIKKWEKIKKGSKILWDKIKEENMKVDKVKGL